MEQAACGRRDHQQADGVRPRGLAEDRHATGIAAEGGDVVAHPSQRRDLILEPQVARGPILGVEFRMGEEAEDAEPVVDRHKDDARARQRGPIVDRQGAGSEAEAPAVDPHYDGPFLAGGVRGGPDVQRQAILAVVDRPVRVAGDADARTPRAEAPGVQRPPPGSTGRGGRQRKGPTGGAA